MKGKLIALLLASATLYAACRKTDRVAEGPPAVKVEEKFFKSHASNDPLVQSLTKKMKQENQQRPFIETIIRKIGYPQWDKSMVISKQDIPDSGRNSTGDSVDIVYIPFVRNSENYVNASLLFKVSPSDTAYQYLLDWEYESYGFDSTGEDWNARDVFHLFAHFDREVFGRTTFRITDERIFGVPEGQERYVKLRPQQGTGQRQNILVYTTICDEVDHCYAPPGESPCAECTTNCPQHIFSAVECTTAWVEDGWVPAGGGSTGNGGTGGGSTGGSGGYPPPECPSVAIRNGVVPNCGPGWIPVEPGGGSWTPPNDSTIAANLKRLILKAGDTVNLVHAAAQTDGDERTFTFIRDHGDTLVKWIRTGASHSSSPTLTGYSFAIFHTHQEDDTTIVYFKNECFDGPDIYKLYKNVAVDGYPIEVSVISTRDYYYAAVITDINKFKIFIQSIGGGPKLNKIENQLDTLHARGIRSCNIVPPCNWELKTEMGALALTSNNNSAVSGIKLFRSPRTNINFTLLTH